MSAQATQDVWSHSTQSGTGLLSLLAIAWYADESGITRRPVAQLAKRARISERQFERVTKQLVASGELEVTYQRGRGLSNIYTVLVGGEKPDIQGQENPTSGAENPTSGAENPTYVSGIPEENPTSGVIKPDIAMSPLNTKDSTKGVVEDTQSTEETRDGAYYTTQLRNYLKKGGMDYRDRAEAFAMKAAFDTLLARGRSRKDMQDVVDRMLARWHKTHLDAWQAWEDVKEARANEPAEDSPLPEVQTTPADIEEWRRQSEERRAVKAKVRALGAGMSREMVDAQFDAIVKDA